MGKIKRLTKSFYRLLLPIVILLVLAVGAASVWLVQQTSIAPTATYLVTPEKYGQLSARGARVTDETWTNRDGSTSRGWLLRGVENAPAVLLLHRYGTDRSHLLDLGVKLNEATNYTILMPDLRGHGDTPHVRYTTFGGCETDDAAAAIEFLRGLKTDNHTALVGQSLGIYGVEMGAIVGLFTAAKDTDVKALVLDSAPADSDDLLASAIGKRFPFLSSVTSKFAQLGTYGYFYGGCYKRTVLCETAQTLSDRKVFLFAGMDMPNLQDSTVELSKCFSKRSQVESKTDLNPSGYGMTGASIEQTSAYHQKVIEFFKGALGEATPPVQTEEQKP